MEERESDGDPPVTKLSVLFAATALALSVWCACSWLVPRANVIEIVQDGTITATVDLARERGRRTICINSPDGGSNTLLIEDGRACVLSADCPGHDCVRMGVLRSPSAPLVCLPHRLVVRFAPRSSGTLDGISQ